MGLRTKRWDIQTGIGVAPLPPWLLQLMPLCGWDRERLGQPMEMVLVTKTELV